jgi:hypothetical protein
MIPAPHYPISHPRWFLPLALYGVLFGLKKAHIYIFLVSDYLADLVAMPIILGIVLWAWRQRPERAPLPLPRIYVASTVFLFSVLFEWIFPAISPRFTADPWDIGCYALGAMAFCLWLNRY